MNYELANMLWKYENGKLYWRIKVGRGIAVKYPGDMAGGTPDDLGYYYVSWKRKHYFLHRMVFLLAHGWLPDCIDHIDGNPSNNLVENLRAASRLQNQHNRRINKNSSSGVKNVSRSRLGWQVRFSVLGKTKHFGVFSDVELAELVAAEIREKLHGGFARHV